MSSGQVLSPTPANPGINRRASGASGKAEAEALASLKRTLLVAALETAPRFRRDLDVVMIQQHLASLGVFASVAPQILQCTWSSPKTDETSNLSDGGGSQRARFSFLDLATECTINRIPDGEVLFYQEDLVDDHSHAYIILEGSLCGYFNKAFSQRHSRSDDFRSWNSKKTNAKGVTIDFGDLQVTYGKGVVCGIDDFYSYPLPTTTREGRHHVKPLCRRRSVHSQESTIIIVLAKDTLDRVSERFGFVCEKGVLNSSKESARTDVSHLALLSLLSDTAKRSLLQTASTRQLKMGEVLFAADTSKDSITTGFAIVRHGCLDIQCVDSSGTPAPGPVNGQGLTTPKDPLASLTRGQTFGDQMVALGHTHIWASNARRRHPTKFCFQVVAGDSSTEVLWVTRDQFDQHVREDQLRLSYNPIFGMAYTTYSTTALMSAIENRDISQLTRQLLTDATLSKFFFQFPPLVLDRLCHHMELQHYDSNGIVLETGGTIDYVYIVVTGALHSHYFSGLENDRSASQKTFAHQGSARRMSRGKDVHFIPGDAFGARELMNHASVCEAPVVADAGTLLLCITMSTFERWVSPMRHNTIVKAGSFLQPFVWSNSSPPSSPRQTYTSTSSYSSLKINRRQSGPSAFSSAVVAPGKGKAQRLDEAAILLKRLGLFQTLPRFLLAQMLPFATLLSRNAGEELFREGDAQRALVVILSGFVSFYSLENMSATIDMFQKHPFCVFNTFSGSTVNPEDFVAEPKADENEGLPPPAALKHRAAMTGVHIQTLPSHNSFRTGILQEGTVCPATVLAQTDCQYLMFDENMYARLLADHVPAVNMGDFNSLDPEPAIVSSSTGTSSDTAPKLLGKTVDHPPGTIPPALLSYLEASRIPWLPPSSAKKTLLLRSMVHVHLAPGQRLIRHDETLRQIVLVVSGKLTVYVRESQDVTSVLNASQRSVQNIALERRVASNYSTTSQQLYQERSGTAGTANRRALQRKIARISEVETSDQPKPIAASSNSRFTDFVLHAAREAKTQEPAKTDSLQSVPHVPKTSPSTRRSLHSMVNKVKFQRKSGHPSISSSTSGYEETTRKTLFMFYLGPGDIHGDEITAPGGIFRSVHDIYADTALPCSPGEKKATSSPNRVQGLLAGTEVLCLDRHVLHSILSKTEEEAANELTGRSSNAKAKWQLASEKLFKRASHLSFEEPGDYIRRKKTPKLFDFFKNILNQRRFLTMSIIAHFPLLRDLPDDTHRELCLNARFEALDRHTDAYKGNGDGNGTGHRFFLLLTGRIHLVANGPNSHILSQSTRAASSDHGLREVFAGESFGEFEILSPEAPAYIAAIAAEPTKLLSIPAEMFMRHWPCTTEARANIEYLRTKIPSFSSLDLERITYLYHSFSFQSHVRGTNIFQFHDANQSSSTTKEVYLIKEGSCCIRQYVTVSSRSDIDARYDPCGNDRAVHQKEDTLPAPAKKNVKDVKVLATVADVSAGHVFWIDRDHYPITLVATSAAVTIASISVDKLKAIVPRGLLASLEELSDELCELYAQQFELAKRVTATVMNEKLVAQIRQAKAAQRLPTIQPRGAPNDELSQTCEDEEVSSSSSSPNANIKGTKHSRKTDASYFGQHQIEHYDIPNELPVSSLVGSFLDKKHRHVITSEDPGVRQTARDIHKQGDFSEPELTTTPVAIKQIKPVTLVRLSVRVPVVGHCKDDRPRSSNRIQITPPSGAPAGWRTLSQKSSRGIPGLLSVNLEVEMASNQDGIVIYEVDIRARVRAEMSMVGSPMRSMRLEPSRTPVNTLGKYNSDRPSPFAGSGDSYRRQLVQLETTSPTQKGDAKSPKQKPRMTTRANSKLLRAIGSPRAPLQPALTRKQGFLTCLRVRNATAFDDDGRDFLDAVLPRIHHGKRFFYVLVDSELREYADTISISNLAQTPCVRSYNLHNPRRACTISDGLTAPGEAEALLRQSFLLIVDDSTQFLFTAPNAVEKQKWMAELTQASVLGDLQHSVSVKVQSLRPVVDPHPPANPEALASAVIDAFKGRHERKRSSIFMPKPKPNDALEVEYRIS